MFQPIIQYLQSQWLPAICLHCKKRSDQKIQLCSDCYASLPWIKVSCIRCGIPMGSNTNIKINTCRNCQQSPPPFDATITPFQYAPPMDSLMRGLKFHHRLAHAKLFSQLMMPILKQHYQGQSLPEVIIPVPLHPKRLRQRGFNQSIEIAKPIAKGLHLPINTNSCQRVIHTKSQSSLDAKQRKANVQQAFGIKKPLAQKHIAMLDDVMTTTSTVGELAGIFKDAGVERIDVWCCVRA